MGVVHLFGHRKASDEGKTSDAANSNEEFGAVVELIVNKKIANGVSPQVVYRQMEALLVTHGVDFSCEKVRSDYKIVTYLVQGMMDRAGGKANSDRCLMLDTLRHALAYEDVVPRDTNELFGDLLGRLD